MKRICKSCEQPKPTDAFPRYERNGRLSAYCSACTDAWHARPTKPRAYFRTSEYRRIERRRAAERAGKSYRTGEQKQLGKIERQAQAHALKVFREWIKSISPLLPQPSTIADTEQRNAKFRERYWSRPQHERARTANYKMRNWNRKLEWDATRQGHIDATADGTVTTQAIRELKQRSRYCAYCQKVMDRDEKQTDHVVPLCRGGIHGMSNIVIVCASCNGSKSTLTLGEWIARKMLMYKELGSSPQK